MDAAQIFATGVAIFLVQLGTAAVIGVTKEKGGKR